MSDNSSNGFNDPTIDPVVENLWEPLTEQPVKPIVATDKSDYAPGETAVISGSGYAPGSEVVIQIVDDLDDPGDDEDADVYEPITVIADEYGAFTTTWFVPIDDDGSGGGTPDALNATLNLTATGSDGQAATTTFTDALPLKPPVQTYFVPLREDDLFTSFDTIQSNTDGDIVTIISVAIAADNTIIYYDHWEDGYEADVLNPSAAGTGIEIWGDGLLSNGARPGATMDAEDVLNAGDAIVLENTVPVNPRGSSVLYDASDRIQATFPIAVTRGGYPTIAGSFSPGTVLAGAVEVLDTDNWGKEFVVPVGQNIPGASGTGAFEYTAIYIMAGEVNTEVFLNGGTTPVATIDTGENYVLRVNQGDVVTTSSPTQADLVTGDIGSTWETRSYSLAPRADWSNDYYTPVGDSVGGDGDISSGPTQVWLYNPNPTNDIEVTFERLVNGTLTSSIIIVPAGTSALSPAVPDNSGGRFFTAGEEDFFALTQTDSTGGTDNNGQTFDWGHPLIPANQLTSQALIGWGYGNTQNNPSFANYSVVWVTPVTNADIFVDLNGDGVIDQTFDNVPGLASVKITDPGDKNMSGALIYATDTTGNLANPVDIATAWGQDPAITGGPGDTTAQSRSLDLGTLIPALPILEAGKTSQLTTDADADGEISPGDTLLYSISIVNIGQVDLPAGSFNVLDFFSPVFDDATYVTNSTFYDINGDAIPDQPIADVGATAFPLDEDGFYQYRSSPKKWYPNYYLRGGYQ